MKLIKKEIPHYILFFFYFIILLLEFKKYTVWNQITDVFNESTNVDPLMLINSFNAHTLRLLLMYPIIKLSSALSIDADVVFTGIVFLNILLTTLILHDVQGIYSKAHYNNIIISLSMIIISLAMNGRTSFSFLGVGIIAKSMTYFQLRRIQLFRTLIYFVFGLILCSVSSGSFSVALLSILIFILFCSMKGFFTFLEKIKLVTISAILLIPVVFIMKVFIQKNLEFYDNSIINMLNHGAGILFKNIYILLLILLLLPLLFLIGIITIRPLINNSQLRIIVPFVISGLVIGIFGFTSFWTSFPMYILFVITLINTSLRSKL